MSSQTSRQEGEMAYTITIWNRGKQIVRRYATAIEAQQAAERIFAATGVIVGIERHS